MLNLREKLDTLREGVGSVKDRLSGVLEKAGSAAAAGAGVALRSTGIQAAALNMLGDDPAPAPISEEQKKKELETQKEIHYKSGYASDDLGNRTERLPIDDRKKIAMMYPEGINEVLDESEREGFEVPEAPRSRLQAFKDLFGQQGIAESAPTPTAAAAEPQQVRIIPQSEADAFKDAPTELQGTLDQALKHLNRFTTGGEQEPGGRQYDVVKPTDLLAKIAGEGGWNAKAGNKAIDYGMTQLNASKRKDLQDPQTEWGRSWQENFGSKYGSFNEDDPTHQILGATVVLAVARQELADAHKRGELIRKPTKDDAFVAYNMDYKQVIDAINGKNYTITVTDNNGKKVQKSLQQQYNDYLGNLKEKGLE